MSTTGVTTAHSDTTFHPLAMLKHEILSHDDGLSLPKVNSMVFLKGIIYLRDTSGSTRGQILSYSVMERSWDTYISTPGEAVRGYHLAVWASSLVLVGGYVELKTCHWQKTFKVWVRQGNEWNADIIPPVQIHENDEILSVAGYDHHLFVLCKQPYSNFSPLQNICVLYYCDDVSTKQWQVLKGPSIIVEYHQRVSILVHDTTVVYAMIYSESSYYKAFFRGHIIMDNMTLCDIEWEQLHVIGGDITGRAYLTVFGGNVVIAELGREVKLYTPFKDTLVDIDELNLQLLYCACGIIGISDGSLIVIDDVEVDSDTLKSAVVQFKSEVQPYDCNKRFTIRALKKLERAANIPLLSDQAVEQKLREIKTCVGFKVQTHHDASTSSFLQYMHSWLSSTQCATEPTWSSLLDALRSVNLMEQAKQIEDCLKTARVVVEPKTKEATGLEEVHKLQAKLQSLLDQLHVNSTETVIPQNVQDDIDASYKLCITAVRKVKLEQSALKGENEKLSKDKSQLIEEKNQLLNENEYLKEQLAAADQTPPAKRQHLDEVSMNSDTSYLDVKDTSDVLESVWEARSKWYNIGLKLGILPDTLDSIKSTDHNPDDCITTMIKNWLRNGKPNPTWKAIDEALRSPMVGYGQLADQLKHKI